MATGRCIGSRTWDTTKGQFSFGSSQDYPIEAGLWFVWDIHMNRGGRGALCVVPYRKRIKNMVNVIIRR